MIQEIFIAGVQYGDLKGSASADNHDFGSARKYLEDQGELAPGEIVVGIEVFSGEVHEATQDRPVYVKFFVGAFDKYETLKDVAESGQPVPVRSIRRDMMLNEFFGLFKRFSITVSSHGLLDGKEIKYDE